MEFWKSKKGQYSLEVVISMALISLIVGGIIILFGSTISEGNGLLLRARAQALVGEGMNAMRSIRDRDMDLLTPGTHGLAFVNDTWNLSGTSDQTNGNFLRTIEIVDVDDDTKELTVEISWSFLGRQLLTSASTRFTDWENVEVWGDWGNPVIVGALDIGPQGKATGVNRNGNIVYLTADASSGNVPTFFTIDVSDLTNPFIIDSYVTSKKLSDLVYIPNSNLVYTVGDNNNEELIIFDVGIPASIQLDNDDGLEDDGMSVFLDDSILAIGTKDGVILYDVSSPYSPDYLSTYSVGEHVHGLAIEGDYLYATSHINDQELIILSIADPYEPLFVGSVDTAGSTDGISVTVNGNDLYLGLKKNSGSNPELYHYDRTDPVNLIELESFDVGGEVNGIVTAGPYVYLASGASNQEFQVYRLSGGTLSFVTGLNMAQKATGIDFDGNTIFLSIRSNDAFQIIQPSP